MKTTKYLRKALVSQISPRVDIKNDLPYITDIMQVAAGEGFDEYYNKLFTESKERDKKRKNQGNKEAPKTDFEILFSKEEEQSVSVNSNIDNVAT